MKSPPPSKKAKFSFIQYLDSHSKVSLKREASKMSDSDSSFNSPDNEAVKSRESHRTEVMKTPLRNSSESGFKKEPLLPRCPELNDGSEDIGKETYKKDSLMKFMFSKKSNCVDDNKEKQNGSKMSLFKAFSNAKPRLDDKPEGDFHGSKDSGISMSQNSNDDDDGIIEITSEYTQSQTEKSTNRVSLTLPVFAIGCQVK